jgi:O-antigen/teichoic acid export membrane protein
MPSFDAMSRDRVVGTVNLARNSAWNFAGFAATLISHFVTIPIVVRAIGLAEFGKAGLVISIWAPFVLIGTVIGQAALREVAAELGSGNHVAAGRSAWTALSMVAVIAAAAAAALMSIGPLLVRHLGAVRNDSQDWLLAFGCYGVGWYVQQIGLVYQGVAAAFQNYRAIAISAIVTGTVMIATTAGLLHLWPRMESYLLGMAGGAAAGTAIWPLLVNGVRATGAGADYSGERKRLIKFGKWQGTNYVAAALGNQVDRYVLAALSSSLVLGQFNAANRLQEAAYAGLSKLTEVLFPYFGSRAQRTHQANRDAILVASWIVGLISGAVLGPIVPLARPLLRLWVGSDVGETGGIMLQTLVLGGIAGSAANVVIYYFLARNLARRIALLSVAFSTATVGGAIILIWAFGPVAAGAAAFAVGVIRIMIMLSQFRRETAGSVSWAELLVAAVLPVTVALLVPVALARGDAAHPTQWTTLAIWYGAYGAALVTITIVLSLAFPIGRRLLRLLWTEVLSRERY